MFSSADKIDAGCRTPELFHTVTTVVVRLYFSSYPGFLAVALLLSCHPGLTAVMASPFKEIFAVVGTYQADSSSVMGINQRIFYLN